MFGCCRRTVERHMKDYGISIRNYTDISQSELDSTVKDISSLFLQTSIRSLKIDLDPLKIDLNNINYANNFVAFGVP